MSPAIFLTHHSRVWNNTLAVLAIVLPVSPALPRVDTWSPMSFSITFFFPTQSGAIVHQRTYANAQRNAPLIQTQQLYKDWQQSQDSPSCSPNTGGQRFPHNHNIGPKCWEFCRRHYWLHRRLTNRLWKQACLQVKWSTVKKRKADVSGLTLRRIQGILVPSCFDYSCHPRRSPILCY